MLGYVIAYVFGATSMAAVIYFWPQEKTWIANELAAIKAEIRSKLGKTP